MREEELKKKTMKELYKISQDLKVKNYSHYRKNELIKKILEKMSDSDVKEETKTENAVKVEVRPERKSDYFPYIPKEEQYIAKGILEILPEGYGFLRTKYTPSSSDIYVAPSQIKRFNLRVGDEIEGWVRKPPEKDKYPALLKIISINNLLPEQARRRPVFETLTPIFPNERIRLETPNASSIPSSLTRSSAAVLRVIFSFSERFI